MIHPLLAFRVRGAVRDKLRGYGYSLRDAISLAQSIDSDTIAAATSLSQESRDEVERVGAIGDGTIWTAITTFLQSPAGQALIAAILKLLIGV